MLSVGVVGAGGVSYYFESVSSGVDDYYLAAEPGTWYGTGAEGLGLAGTIDGADLHAVLEGRHPTTGAALGRAGKVAGFDLTFSAPKSVSVLAELGPPDVRTAVLAAHHAAVAGAVALLEEHALRGRRGHGGVSQVATAGAIAAGFDHHTSRAGDPQTHTHVLVANRAQGTDGVWGALYGQRVFAWAKTAGVAYQAFLRAELTAALGVGWGPVVNGMADLAALPAAVVDRFSTRRAQIVAELAARHREGPRAAQVAALATRPPKPEPLDPGTQRALWWDRAATAGFSPADLLEVLGPGRAPATLHPAGLAAELTAPAGLTGRRSVVDARHLYQAVAAAHPEGLDPKSLAALAAAVVAHPDVVSLPGRTLHAGATWTTAELAAAETAVMAGAARRLDAGVGVCPAAAVESALAARPSLSAEQQAMVRRLCCSGSGVDVVVGRPGTGKTFALDAARAAWETSGTAVVGAAVAARTARALEAGTAIPSTSLDSLLADLARPEVRLAPGTVIVVDEAGMVGTRPLARLLHGAEANHAKIVLTGDPAQLPELEAGGAFAALAKTLPAVELTVNRRQAHAWERAALDAVRAGTPAPAVAAYRQAGRLNFADTAEAARNALVADWAAAGDEGAAMVAMTRADVDDLNGLTRAHLVATGRLTAAGVDLAGTTFGVGDRIMALRNDRRIGVLNGTTGTLTAVGADGTIHLRPDDTTGAGPDIALPAGYVAAGNVAHAWAVTIHKAQGMTVGRAFVLGSERLYREAGYVALSRATERTDWYQVGAAPSPWDTTATPEQAAARLLARSAAQQLATRSDTGQPLAGPPAPGLAPTGPALGAQTPGPPPAPRPAAPPTGAVQPGDQHAAHLSEVLGPRPAAGPGRRAWDDAAVAIEQYRRRHGIDGPDPLGAEPPDGARRRRWLAVRAAIDNAHSPDLARRLDFGPDL